MEGVPGRVVGGELDEGEMVEGAAGAADVVGEMVGKDNDMAVRRWGIGNKQEEGNRRN